ncbi:WAT1-related protein At1g09380-like [Asparagus officinalis]|uniref:WAT1-related protein At1g09380-like n=1 Tax=Asparagus officinalis TaxID=4686 RepID=UPI00098E5657|nr:WAT1-related protein At1g09380-like [Asparagus officinalis]
MGSSQFGEGLTLLGERLERINLKSKSGIAKVAGTLVCLAGAMLLSFYKGLALTNASHKPSAPNEDSGHSIRGKWILGTVALFAAIFSWSSWFLLQTKVSEKYPALYTGTAIVILSPLKIFSSSRPNYGRKHTNSSLGLGFVIPYFSQTASSVLSSPPSSLSFFFPRLPYSSFNSLLHWNFDHKPDLHYSSFPSLPRWNLDCKYEPTTARTSQGFEVLTEPKNALGKQYKKLFSMNNVDAFVVDEEAIGSGDKPGRGAKILRGDGALDHYLTKNKLKGPGVRL